MRVELKFAPNVKVPLLVTVPIWILSPFPIILESVINPLFANMPDDSSPMRIASDAAFWITIMPLLVAKQYFLHPKFVVCLCGKIKAPATVAA